MGEIGNYDNIPSVYKNNLEDKPSGLWDQLQTLSKCGFRDVDCFYKYSIFELGYHLEQASFPGDR